MKIGYHILQRKNMQHIGKAIKKELARQERSVTWLARQLFCDRSNIYRIFQKESLDTHLLARISIILRHNFFLDLAIEVESQFSQHN